MLGLTPGRCTVAEERQFPTSSEVPVTMVRQLLLPSVRISGVSRPVRCRVRRTLLWLNVLISRCTGEEVMRVTIETTFMVLTDRNGRNRLLLFEH